MKVKTISKVCHLHTYFHPMWLRRQWLLINYEKRLKEDIPKFPDPAGVSMLTFTLSEGILNISRTKVEAD